MKENNSIPILEQSGFSIPFVGWLVGQLVGWWFEKQFHLLAMRKCAWVLINDTAARSVRCTAEILQHQLHIQGGRMGIELLVIFT